RPDVAMTGEITLRGLILPIGGLKEKSLAAMRAGISTVIIPKLNEKDLVDVPEEAKQKLKFIPVENVDEVLNAALEKKTPATSARSKLRANSRPPRDHPRRLMSCGHERPLASVPLRFWR